jgi:hypothetical protein
MSTGTGDAACSEDAPIEIEMETEADEKDQLRAWSQACLTTGSRSRRAALALEEERREKREEAEQEQPNQHQKNGGSFFVLVP